MRGARQLPAEHIQLVTAIKKERLKQATLKLSYLKGETVEESLVDLLGCSYQCETQSE